MSEPRTFTQKISEPILNVKQIIAMCFTILYEVISNLIYAIVMVDPNWTFIILNILFGIIIIVFIGLMRAAYPEEVPDRTIWAAFWSIWKQIVDMVTDPNPAPPELRMEAFEKFIQWTVREWDIAYEEKLDDNIQYYKEMQNAKIETLEKEKAELESEL